VAAGAMARPATTNGPDKAQLFALRLTRRKFAKNAVRQIPRQFSIAADSRSRMRKSARAPFRNHIIYDL
jgi:hypothetical protein